MELRHIRYFLALASHQNFTRAAAELHIVQSALSQQIKKLEQDFNVQLFRRDSGGVNLTAAGEAFLPVARRIMAEVGQAVVTLRKFSAEGDVDGSVNFGLMHVLGLGAIDVPELLGSFASDWPDVNVMVNEGTTENLLGLLRQGKIDAAVIDMALVDNVSELQYEEISSEPLIVIVGKDHRLAGREEADISEFASDRFMQVANGSTARLDSIVQVCNRAGFLPNFAMFPPNVAMARALVSENLGVYITYPWIAQTPGPPVWAIRLRGSPLVNRLGLVWTGRLNSDVVSFLNFAWPALNFRGTATPKLPLALP